MVEPYTAIGISVIEDGRGIPKTMQRWTKRLLASLAIVGTFAIGFAGYIGYLGGPVFVPVPPSAKPPVGQADVAVVVLSGDMGFKVGMGPAIAQRLAGGGIPVIGVNSLTYFRTLRSPQEVTALISEAMRRAKAISGVRRIILVGQSFGADMLQVGLAGLPEAQRSDIALVVLVVPGETVIFQASPAELLDVATPDAPALPTVRQLTWVPVACIYGVDETNSLCPQLTMPNVRRLPLPGGHPLRRDSDRLSGAIADAISQLSTK